MRALVTGADGFIGRHLVRCLLAEGFDVCVMTRQARQPNNQRINTVCADLLDVSTLSLSPDRVGPLNVVFHLAAVMPNADVAAHDFITGNGTATSYLVQECLCHNIPRFIYCSSIGVVGSPQTNPVGMSHPVDCRHPYFEGKRAGELACFEGSEKGLNTQVFRLTSPYGPQMPSGSVLPLFISRALQGLPLTWHGTGSRAQDFIYVDDVVNAFLLAATASKSGAYYLGSGKATTMKQLAQEVASHFERVTTGPSGQPDVQEGIVWRADIADLLAAFPQIKITPLDKGLARYIASLNEPPQAWWQS